MKTIGIFLGILGLLLVGAFSAVYMTQPAVADQVEAGPIIKKPCDGFAQVVTQSCNGPQDLRNTECADHNGDACQAVCLATGPNGAYEWNVRECPSGECRNNRACKPRRAQITDLVGLDDDLHRGP